VLGLMNSFEAISGLVYDVNTGLVDTVVKP
jgi:hypothetical protein